MVWVGEPQFRLALALSYVPGLVQHGVCGGAILPHLKRTCTPRKAVYVVARSRYSCSHSFNHGKGPRSLPQSPVYGFRLYLKTGQEVDMIVPPSGHEHTMSPFSTQNRLCFRPQHFLRKTKGELLRF